MRRLDAELVSRGLARSRGEAQVAIDEHRVKIDGMLARKAATGFHTIYHRAFKIAAGEYRAPLRIAAIGVVLWYFAIAALILAGLMAVS